MNKISFMSANFVAREVDYMMKEGWGQGDSAAQELFRPINTFEKQFSCMLDEVVELGFNAIDLWTAHLHWAWATPAHIKIAKRLLEEKGISVVSYAGSYGNTPAELEASCQICDALAIPVLGGGLGCLQSDRDEVVHILRNYGKVFAIENHPEKSAAEVLEKLGDGDEDVIGVAVDTGWFATQEADVLEQIRQLYPRIKHVHLKDILEKRAEKTGFMFQDMGHETCELGKGIVPLQECLDFLISKGYRGALSIEHEPEEFDPREDCGNSLTNLKEWIAASIRKITPANPVGVAIVGCGNIADRYAAQISTYPHVKLIGSQDIDKSRADALAAEFGGEVYDSLDEVLADGRVEVVVNLTIHHVHEEIIRKCLNAGKHVHTEKPLALDSRAAWGLVDIAEEKGLRLSSAPTTWLGETQQSAFSRIKNNEIGQPRVAYAEVNWGRIESWHPNPGPFYDVGVLFDVAVYPITLLTAWFGRVKTVTGGGKIVYPNRHTKDGTPFSVSREDIAVAVLEFESGMIARITSSFYVGWNSFQQGLEVHGDDGMIRLRRWDQFDTPAWIASPKTDGQVIPLIPDEYPAEDVEYPRGLSDLAHAIREGRQHKTTGTHAAYVVEIVEAIRTSIKEKKAIDITIDRFEPQSS